MSITDTSPAPLPACQTKRLVLLTDAGVLDRGKNLIKQLCVNEIHARRRRYNHRT